MGDARRFRMKHRRANPDKRHRDENKREIRSDRKQGQADEGRRHAERERERLRMFVGERADDGLKQRSRELVRQSDQPDVAVIKPERVFQDRINRGDQRLQRIVDEMSETQREENPEYWGSGRRLLDVVVDASGRAVRRRFGSGSHRDTLKEQIRSDE